MLNAKNFGSHIKMHENFAAISNTYPWNIHLIEKKGPLNMGKTGFFFLTLL